MQALINTIPDNITISEQEDGLLLTMYISDELDYFQGHFPGAPILPGVVQLDWAIQFAKQYLMLSSGAVKTVEVLKYQEVIFPNQQLSLMLIKKSNNKFTFKYSSNKGVHASGRVVLEDT